ncbi:MAG: hypothetical protein ACM3X9_13555 [Bacillota bacterium]
MGILEESKVAQVINRLESTKGLLREINEKDPRFKEKFSQMINKLEGYEKELWEIKKQLNVENLGVNPGFAENK